MSDTPTTMRQLSGCLKASRPARSSIAWRTKASFASRRPMGRRQFMGYSIILAWRAALPRRYPTDTLVS